MYVHVSLVTVLYVGVALSLNTWELPREEPWKRTHRELDDQWILFKKAYNRTYEGTEDIHRRLYWEDNLRLVQEHNLKYDRGESSYTLGENHFSDMADDEFEKMYLRGLQVPDDDEYPPGLTEPDPTVLGDIDWVNRGLVTSVKNQGQCGSCWAYSAVAALEGQVIKTKGRTDDLSEQMLVDCDRQSGGCRGGWMNNAFQYIQRSGMDTEQCYPYRGRDQSCQASRCRPVTRLRSYQNVGRSEYSLQSDLSRVGPISIAADVSSPSFRFYRSGVINDANCNPSRPNHAMTAVGYGSYGGREFWKVKNSWGQSWGVKGYVFMIRNHNNQCGIASFASYPTV